MSTSTGRPALALLDASQIPVITAPSALRGLAAGFLAAVALASDRSTIAKTRFEAALMDARRNPAHDYAYSRGFLMGAETAKADLAELADAIAGRTVTELAVVSATSGPAAAENRTAPPITSRPETCHEP